MEYNEEICKLKHELVDQRIDGVVCQLTSFGGQLTELEKKIDNVITLQRVQTYSIIGVLITAILILIGVILGRGIDFGLVHI